MASECQAEQSIADLTGLRLGKHERQILLQGPGPGEETLVILPDGEGRSADEANRRAMRRLERAGLLERWCKYCRVNRKKPDPWWKTRGVWKIAVRLTPLGQAVRDHLREHLATGKRIRWAEHTEALGRSLV